MSANTLKESANSISPIRGWKNLLLVGTILGAFTPALANAEITTKVQPVEFTVERVGEIDQNSITVSSSDGNFWDVVEEGEYKIRISGKTDTEKLGSISSINLYTGMCITDQCNAHHPIWYTPANQPVYEFDTEIDFSRDDLLTLVDDPRISPASLLGGQLVAECNAMLDEPGAQVNRSMIVKLPFTMVMHSEKAGSIARTATAEFLLHCAGFEDDFVEADVETEPVYAGHGGSNSDYSAEETSSGYSDEDEVAGLEPDFTDDEDGGFEEDLDLLPEEEGEEPPAIDLGDLFPFPLPLPPV
ncbi:MAG: hypothetical protein AAGF54_20810, partial [Pseudomonadota bacterium]